MRQVEKERGLEVLQTGRAWLANESHWCRERFSVRDADGCLRTCAMGAVAEFWKDAKGQSVAYRALRRAFPADFQRPQHGLFGIAYYNDDPATTHADILALYDRAIANLRSEGGRR